MAGGYPNSSLIFRDTFRRVPRSEELGDGWDVVAGDWSVVEAGDDRHVTFDGDAAEARVLAAVNRPNFVVTAVPRATAGNTYRPYRLRFTCEKTGKTGYLESPASSAGIQGVRLVYDGVERWLGSQYQYGLSMSLRVWTESADDEFQIIEVYYQYSYFGPVDYYPAFRIPKMEGPVWISLGGDAAAEPLGFSSVEISRLEYQDLEKPCLSKPTRLCRFNARSSLSSCLKLTIAGVADGDGTCQADCLNGTYHLGRYVTGYDYIAAPCGWSMGFPTGATRLPCMEEEYNSSGGNLQAWVLERSGRYYLHLRFFVYIYSGGQSAVFEADLGEDLVDGTELDVSNFVLVSQDIAKADFSGATFHAESVDGDPCEPPEYPERCDLLENCGLDPPEELRIGVGGVVNCPAHPTLHCDHLNQTIVLARDRTSWPGHCYWGYSDDDYEAFLHLRRVGTRVLADGYIGTKKPVGWFTANISFTAYDVGPLPIGLADLDFSVNWIDQHLGEIYCVNPDWDHFRECDRRGAVFRVSIP